MVATMTERSTWWTRLVEWLEIMDDVSTSPSANLDDRIRRLEHQVEELKQNAASKPIALE